MKTLRAEEIRASFLGLGEEAARHLATASL